MKYESHGLDAPMLGQHPAIRNLCLGSHVLMVTLNLCKLIKSQICCSLAVTSKILMKICMKSRITFNFVFSLLGDDSTGCYLVLSPCPAVKEGSLQLLYTVRNFVDYCSLSLSPSLLFRRQTDLLNPSVKKIFLYLWLSSQHFLLFWCHF